MAISGVIDYLTKINLRDLDISVRATAVQVTVRRGAVVVGLTVVVGLGRVGDVVVVVCSGMVVVVTLVVVSALVVGVVGGTAVEVVGSLVVVAALVVGVVGGTAVEVVVEVVGSLVVVAVVVGVVGGTVVEVVGLTLERSGLRSAIDFTKPKC
jgi:hypothetical protein